MAMLDSLSVVFPMFNEKDYIRKTIAMTIDTLKDITGDYEIIIVDDASTDGSGLIADELANQNQFIKVAHHKKNRKLGGSLKTGFNLAGKKYILYSDIDMPFEFSEVKKAAEIIRRENADFVSAYRINREVEGIKRYIYSSAYNFFIRVLFGLKIRDVNFSFKLIKQELLKKLKLFSEGSFIDAEMLIKAKRCNAIIIQFPTKYFPRFSGSSRLSSLNVIFKILQESLAFRLGFLE